MALVILLSRINGDVPRAQGLAAALRIVREQAVFNRRREAAHFGEHPKRKLRCSRYYEATFDSKLL
jgi:hypothetical protein